MAKHRLVATTLLLLNHRHSLSSRSKLPLILTGVVATAGLAYPPQIFVRSRSATAVSMSATKASDTSCIGSSSSISSLPSFLKRSYDNFSSTSSPVQSSKYHITIGNEAGDADSIVSALVHGHVLRLGELAEHSNKNKEQSSTSITADNDTTYVPLANVPRADLPLRRETTLLLEMAGVDINGVLCIDDPPSVVSLLQQGKDDGGDIKVSLLDHNRIQSSLSHLGDSIVEILDHHEDEGYHSHIVGEERRNVAFEGRDALVASTCTLVAERMFRAVDNQKGKYGDNVAIDPSASLALLGVILLDTMDMNVEAGKGTPRDLAAIEALLEHTDWTKIDKDAMSESARAVFIDDGGGRPSRAALHDLLRNSKFDKEFWSSMSAWDCLRIDYKRFEPSGAPNVTPTPIPFGMSSVLLPLSDFLSKDDCVASLVKWLRPTEEGGAGVPLLGVLTMTLVDDAPHREMLLAGRPDLVDATSEYLMNDSDAAFLQIDELAVDGLVVPEDLTLRRFRQGNAKGSRKQVAPVLMKLASSLSSC